MRIRFICFFLFLFAGMHTLPAQETEIDSLRNLLSLAGDDTSKVNLLDDLCWNLRSSEPEAAVNYGTEGIQLAKKLGFIKGEAAIEHSLGIIYQDQGDYDKALSFYFSSLKIREKRADLQGMAVSYNNIGNIYRNQNNLKKALEYHRMALKIFENSPFRNRMASSLNNIGNIYDNMGEYEQALSYHLRALKIREEIGEKIGISASLNNIGLIYRNLKVYGPALDYFNKALKIKEEIGDQPGMSLTFNNIASVLIGKNKIAEARQNALKALEIARAVDSKEQQKLSYFYLSVCDSTAGNFKSAYENHKAYSAIKDSILNLESAEKTSELQALYESEKKEKAINELQASKVIADEQNKKQEFTIWTIGVGLLIVLVFSAFILNRWQVTKNQKSVIEAQKQEVVEKSRELTEKNKEITDSINYAKRIQRGILPTDDDIKKCFTNYFVLYQPKDIVSGDFYWAVNGTSSKTGINVSLIAAIDCTGHGVPGAFMSMLGNTLLNQTIFDPEVIYPSDVLNFLNRELPQNLKSSVHEISIRDGMDMALCSFDWKNSKMYFAGANNPCWIIRDNQLIELKGDKQAISASTDIEKKPFNNQQFEFRSGDTIYLFTDGYADQFGGPKGKKFKYQQLKDLLLKINPYFLAEQKKELSSAFNSWKGELEQVDDVLLIGVKM
jgi:tetratricopeptide (TPR) repeat protein